MAKHTAQELKQWQALPLNIKVAMTCSRIRGWVNEYGEDGVYISFSGGKDSTVLMDLVRNKCGYKNIRAMFIDVPTQYPELKRFAQTFDNVDIVRPKISFVQVCDKYGFPLISKEVSDCVEGARKTLSALINDGSIPVNPQAGDGIVASIEHSQELAELLTDRMSNRKGGSNRRLAIMLGWLTNDKDRPILVDAPNDIRSAFAQTKYKFLLDAPFEISNKCCTVMKKDPAHKYAKETGRRPITAQMASESRLRMQKWVQNGCNAFDAKNPISNPMSFWTENDILQYIVENHLPICSVYGDIVRADDDGQISLCDMGLLIEDNKVPQYKTTGCSRTGCMLCGFGCHLERSPNRFEQLSRTHPGMYRLLDTIQNNGVTYREAIEWINEHGGLNIQL